MRTTRRVLLSWSIVLFGWMGHCDRVLAQTVSKVGTTAAEFLQIGLGERAVGLGGAVVATSNDAASLHWNPAGITHIEGTQVLFSKSTWIADLDLEYAAAVLNLGTHGHIGASLKWLGYPSMDVLTEEYQDGTGEIFDASDMAFTLAYGRAISDRFRLGGAFKVVRQRIWHSNASTVAFDIGTQFQTDLPGKLVIGASIANFGGSMRMTGRDLRGFIDPDPNKMGNNDKIPVAYETDSWNLPMTFQFGVSVRLHESTYHRLDIALDALHPASNYESVNLGVEYGFLGRFHLRGGYQSMFLPDSEYGWNGGFTYHQRLFDSATLQIGYSYRSLGRLGASNGFGIILEK